jgi:hypothetical protein
MVGCVTEPAVMTTIIAGLYYQPAVSGRPTITARLSQEPMVISLTAQKLAVPTYIYLPHPVSPQPETHWFCLFIRVHPFLLGRRLHLQSSINVSNFFF